MPLIALIVGVSILLMNEREYLKEGIKITREEAIDIAISALRPISRECGNKAAKKIVQEVLKND